MQDPDIGPVVAQISQILQGRGGFGSDEDEPEDEDEEEEEDEDGMEEVD